MQSASYQASPPSNHSCSARHPRSTLKFTKRTLYSHVVYKLFSRNTHLTLTFSVAFFSRSSSWASSTLPEAGWLFGCFRGLVPRRYRRRRGMFGGFFPPLLVRRNRGRRGASAATTHTNKWRRRVEKSGIEYSLATYRE